MTEQLGRLEPVELRDIWKSEAQHFTPWLAAAENLIVLGNTIGIELELEAEEKNVGPFRADILCKDTATGNWVLIENQLERTDHIHLGQLLTYAAGLQAVTIVWVSSNFTDEHRAALDWLNEISDQRCQFFGLEIELWRIGNSPAAPKFNIVSKPNDWTQSVGTAAKQISEGELSETRAQQFRFWSNFTEYLASRESPVRRQKPAAQNWMTFSVGRTGFYLIATINSREHPLEVALYIGHDQAKACFHLLREVQEPIEAELDHRLDWQELPGKKGSRIAVSKDDTDPTNEAEWLDQHAWMADMLERFDKTFRPRVQALNPDDWIGNARDVEDIEAVS